MFIYFIVFLMIFYFIMYLFSSSMNKGEKMNSPFECGFENFKSSRLPYSMKFFLVSVLFLIFDIEIVLYLYMFYMHKMIMFKVVFFFYLFILFMGLYMEWFFGSLSWKF